ncbi:MAG: ABC transporter ATP-binding protein [Rhodoferax sp.]
MDRDGALIRANGLGLRDAAGNWLWQGLTFSLAAGSVAGLLGRNGSGKTTLLRTLMGRVRPSAGALALVRPVGYVPQASQIAFDFTVREVAEMGRAAKAHWLRGIHRADARAVDAALERVGLAGLACRRFASLSGGEQQLALIARALAGETRLLLLDEPLAALDLDNQSLVLRLLSRLATEGLGVLFSTHDPDHLLAVADRALLLHRGQTPEVGTVRELLTAERLSALYGLPVQRIRLAQAGRESDHAVAMY